jgi:hypothetical protein
MPAAKANMASAARPTIGCDRRKWMRAASAAERPRANFDMVSSCSLGVVPSFVLIFTRR